MIEIKDLSKAFPTDRGEHVVLRDINLRIDDGDIFGIIGVSGAGKSTLVRCINLLERPTSGQVLIDGVDVTNYTGKQLLELRTHIGMIFQSFNLFAQRTVLKNVMFPLEIRGDSKKDAEVKARQMLELVGLEDKVKSYPSQLSGGQQQRVSIARALVNQPSIMLCDEATSALDTLTTNSILKLLRDINAELGVTMIIITHAMSVVEKICNRVAVLQESRIVEQGDTAGVFANPQHLHTQRLLGRVSWDLDDEGDNEREGGDAE